MCGITGMIYTDPRHPIDQELVRRMTSTLAHRGPDADGFLFGNGAALGHRRLSILDLAGGDQPIYNEDGTKAVVFNGEIYNFRDLRRDLEARGHRFRTASDTETIVHAWEAYGDGCIRHLRGMFALALWDLRSRRLVLARDRVGKKPLYYLQAADRLIFASELKALIVDPSIKRAIDYRAVDDYLTFGAVPSPRTIYEGIAQLPPAHYLVWENGRVRAIEYWDVPLDPPRPRPESEYLEEFAALFSEAVRLRMISDVPLGAFLSGGIDSSAVVAAMAAVSPRPVLTTCVGFPSAAFNEAPHARAVAEQLGTDHHELMVEPRAADILPTLIWHLDEPFGDSSALPTYYVSKAAREHVKVALSGDGGDELFGGYAWRYGLNLLEFRVRRVLPGWWRHGVLGPLAAAWPKADRLPRALRWKSFLRNLSLSAERAYFHDMSWFTPDDKRALLTADLRRALEDHDPFLGFARHFERTEGQDHLRRITYVDAKTYLTNDILVKVDRMAMANSLEVRAPFLDHKIIEFAARVPTNLKFRGTTSKYLLKRYLERRLPAALVYRPKRGFSIPLAHWLRADLRDLAFDLLLSSRARARGYFVPETVRRLWDAHQRGRRDHAHRLWALMVLELWHRLFVDEGPVVTARSGPKTVAERREA
jgi:asparagine synthase (glutamine-hydrolysing)